jgi:hypothetical protein
VADCDDATEIEGILFRQRPQVIRRAPHVLERTRPTATFIADSPVLDTPYGIPRVSEGLLERSRVGDGVLRQEAAAVNEQNDRMRPGPLRQAQVPELKRAGSIRDPMIRRGRRQGGDTVERERPLARRRHRCAYRDQRKEAVPERSTSLGHGVHLRP